MHSRLAPRTAGQTFQIEVPPEGELSGGRLTGRVLLPERAELLATGGPGFEFFVDDRNYDEAGELQSVIVELQHSRGSEPGRWRLEVQPSEPAIWHEFLVVMRVGAFGAPVQLPALQMEPADGSGACASEVRRPVCCPSPTGLTVQA